MALNLIDKLKKVGAKIGSLNPESQVAQLAKKAAKYLSLGSAALFAATLAFFAKLGGAALQGFIIGATIGGTGGAIGGAILGAQAGAAIGTVVIPIPIVGTVVGGFVGGTIGLFVGGSLGAAIFGTAGGLIALGLASGSATAVSTGVGVGVGAAIGGYAGGVAATAAWGLVVAACAAVTGGACGILVAFTPAVTATGVALGSVGGAVVGGAVGYVVGKYFVDPIKSYIKGVPNSVGSAASGTIAGIGHFVTGLASAAWGGVLNLGGWLLDGAIGLGSSIWGALTGATGALAGQIAAVSIGVGIATAAGMALISAGILTPGKYTTTQTDKGQNIIPPPGSAYVTVTKTAAPSTLQNSDLPTTINFEVVVSTKSVKIINVTCEDLTTIIRSDSSTRALTVNPVPSCPPTIDANSQIKFNFTTQAENTPEFQNASIVNVFNIYYDIEQLALGSCSTGSGFGNLLPNPPPASAGAVSPNSFSNLDSGQVVPAAVFGAQKSGVACELLVGLQYVEAGWNDTGSFISGRQIGNPEPDVPAPGACTSYNGTWTVSGCVFSSLQDTAYYAGDHIKDKVSALGLGWRPPASFSEMVGAMSKYNGGGNQNCGSTPYTGTCPPPWYGNDDSYAMTHFDTTHATMYLVYCADLVLCNPPQPFGRDGAATAAKEYYLRGAGPFQ